MTFFSERALASVRRFVRRTLVDAVEVRRLAWTNDLNETTLVSNYDDGTQIHTGPARVRPTTQQTIAVGESLMATRNARITFPHDVPAIHRDDVIRITDSPNPELIDRWFQVTGERLAAQEGFVSVEVISIAPSRLWQGSSVDT